MYSTPPRRTVPVTTTATDTGGIRGAEQPPPEATEGAPETSFTWVAPPLAAAAEMEAPLTAAAAAAAARSPPHGGMLRRAVAGGGGGGGSRTAVASVTYELHVYGENGEMYDMYENYGSTVTTTEEGRGVMVEPAAVTAASGGGDSERETEEGNAQVLAAMRRGAEGRAGEEWAAEVRAEAEAMVARGAAGVESPHRRHQRGHRAGRHHRDRRSSGSSPPGEVPGEGLVREGGEGGGDK